MLTAAQLGEMEGSFVNFAFFKKSHMYIALWASLGVDLDKTPGGPLCIVHPGNLCMGFCQRHVVHEEQV